MMVGIYSRSGITFNSSVIFCLLLVWRHHDDSAGVHEATLHFDSSATIKMNDVIITALSEFYMSELILFSSSGIC